MVILKLKKNKLCHHKSPIFLEDVNIEKVLVPKKISFRGKTYKYCIDCLYNDYKPKPLHKMLLKTSVYVKRYDGQAKWMCFD